MDISFLISSLAIGNLTSLKLELCAPTILGIIIWLENKNEVYLQWRESTFTYTSFQLQPWLCHWMLQPLFFFSSHFRQWQYHKNFFPYFDNGIVINQLQQIFFSSYFSNAIATNPFHKFFFLRNDMCIQFLQQILSIRLLLVFIIGLKK